LRECNQSLQLRCPLARKLFLGEALGRDAGALADGERVGQREGLLKGAGKLLDGRSMETWVKASRLADGA